MVTRPECASSRSAIFVFGLLQRRSSIAARPRGFLPIPLIYYSLALGLRAIDSPLIPKPLIKGARSGRRWNPDLHRVLLSLISLLSQPPKMALEVTSAFAPMLTVSPPTSPPHCKKLQRGYLPLHHVTISDPESNKFCVPIVSPVHCGGLLLSRVSAYNLSRICATLCFLFSCAVLPI